MDYGYIKKVNADFDGAVEAVTAALQAQGFGVLTEIDVRGTLKKKLDVEFRPYKILGACNPQLAHRALGEDPEIGLLLPCNVVVQESESGVTVSVVDPKAMFKIVGDARLDEIVAEVDQRMRKVIEALP